MTAQTRIVEVVSLMRLYRYSGLPVVDNGKPVSILAEKDVLARLLPNMQELVNSMRSIDFNALMHDYANVMKLCVADLMTRAVTGFPPDMHILQAAAVMAGKHFRRIPLTEGATPVGMLSPADVHKAVIHASISGSLNAA